MVIRINGDLDNNSIYPQGTNVDQQDDKKYLREMRAAGRQKPDRFSKAGRKKKKEPHFSVFRAGKEFVKGVFRPIGSMLQHPIKAIGSLVVLGFLASVAPITVPIMAVIGFGMGINQALMGIIKASVNYHLGDYKDAEKAFGDIGEGSLAVAGTSAAMKMSGAIAAEAKTTTAALKGATTDEEKIAAVEKGLDEGIKVQHGSWRDAFKETHSVIMNPRAVWSQLNPRTLFNTGLSKGRSFVNLFKQPETVDLEAAYNTAKAHLNIQENEIPKVQIQGTSVPHYNSHSNILYLPENHPNYKLFSNYPRLQALFDRSPKFVQNFVTNLDRKRQIPTEKLIIHELARARQTQQLEQLSESHALDALEDTFPHISNAEKRDILASYNIGRQQYERTLTPKQTQDAKNLVTDIRKAHQAGADVDAETTIAEGKGILPNIAHPLSLEGRKAANDFGKQQALKTLRKKHFYQAEGSKALRQLRTELAEARQNTAIEEWRNAAASGASNQNLEAIEAKAHASRQLFGTSNPTADLLKADQQAKRAYMLQEKMRRFAEETFSDLEGMEFEDEFNHRPNGQTAMPAQDENFYRAKATEEKIDNTIAELFPEYAGRAGVTDDTIVSKPANAPAVQKGLVDSANPKPLSPQKRNPAVESGQPAELESTTQQNSPSAKQEPRIPHPEATQPKSGSINRSVTVEDVPDEEASAMVQDADTIPNNPANMRQRPSVNSRLAPKPENSASQILNDEEQTSSTISPDVIPDPTENADWTMVPKAASTDDVQSIHSSGTLRRSKFGNTANADEAKANQSKQGQHSRSMTHDHDSDAVFLPFDDEEYDIPSASTSAAGDLTDRESDFLTDVETDEEFEELSASSTENHHNDFETISPTIRRDRNSSLNRSNSVNGQEGNSTMEASNSSQQQETAFKFPLAAPGIQKTDFQDKKIS